MMHSYDQFRGDKRTSENNHLEMLDHFRTKIRTKDFTHKTPKEKGELKKVVANCTVKNHRP